MILLSDIVTVAVYFHSTFLLEIWYIKNRASTEYRNK